MKKYDSYDICKNCGDTYGHHAWLDNACPEVFDPQGRKTKFSKNKKFRLSKEDRKKEVLNR